MRKNITLHTDLQLETVILFRYDYIMPMHWEVGCWWCSFNAKLLHNIMIKQNHYRRKVSKQNNKRSFVCIVQIAYRQSPPTFQELLKCLSFCVHATRWNSFWKYNFTIKLPCFLTNIWSCYCFDCDGGGVADENLTLRIMYPLPMKGHKNTRHQHQNVGLRFILMMK